MLTILIKLPRTEKFSIGTEIKTSMYEMLKYILFASKTKKKVIGCHRSFQGLKDYCNVRSIISTCKKQSISFFSVLCKCQ